MPYSTVVVLFDTQTHDLARYVRFPDKTLRTHVGHIEDTAPAGDEECIAFFRNSPPTEYREQKEIRRGPPYEFG